VSGENLADALAAAAAVHVVLVVTDGHHHLALTTAEVDLLAGRDPSALPVAFGPQVELAPHRFDADDLDVLHLLVRHAPEIDAVHVARVVAPGPARIDGSPLSSRLRAMAPCYRR